MLQHDHLPVKKNYCANILYIPNIILRYLCFFYLNGPPVYVPAIYIHRHTWKHN